MKLAVILALAPDRRSGRVVSGLLPADQAMAQVKQAINAGGSPDVTAEFSTLAAVDVGSILRQHRFTIAAPAPAVKPSLSPAKAAKVLRKRAAELAKAATDALAAADAAAADESLMKLALEADSAAKQAAADADAAEAALK